MRVAAFFDMDRTLLTENSGTLWVRFLRQRGEMDTRTFLRILLWTAQYRLAILDMEEVAGRLCADMAGDEEAAMRHKTEIFFARHVLPIIAAEGERRLREHERAGHVVALLTSSTPYMAEPLARHLGIAHVLCTRPHVQDGRFVGTCERPTCYGDGKVHHAERFAQEHGVDLSQSYFYTDSYSDLPMLLRVGQRRVINPDARLRRHARLHGWEIERWH